VRIRLLCSWKPSRWSQRVRQPLELCQQLPVTSIRAGIDVIAPHLWNGAKPELTLTGPNVGSNLAIQTQFPGTVGAATYVAKTAKIPAIAFSGRSGQQTAWNAPTPLYSKVYADLALNVTTTIINSGPPYLPNNTFLNVNFAESRREQMQQLKHVQIYLHTHRPLRASSRR
jgi:5'/3'-nucleotidase SurE